MAEGMIDRRAFLRIGLAAIAAPAIVRATSLMPIKALPIGDGVGLWSISHPAHALANLALDVQDLNEQSLEEMIAMVRRVRREDFPRIVAIMTKEQYWASHGA